MRIASWVLGWIAGAGLVAGAAFAQENSGFLGDNYAKMQDVKTSSGQKAKRWIAPEVAAGKYDAILLEKTTYHPQPEPTAHLSAETLSGITAYLDEAMRRELDGVITVATAPGPKTLRLRPAITASAPKNADLKPYQYVPLAFVFTVATRSKNVSLAMEWEATDLDTNQVVGVGAREGSGKAVKSDTESLTVADFKPAIDVWAKDLRTFVQTNLVKK